MPMRRTRHIFRTHPMNSGEKKDRSFTGRLKVWFLWLAACVAAFTLLGFFALPPLVRPLIEKEMTKALHRKVTIQGLAFNPYRLTVRVRNLSIRDRQGPEAFVSCGEVLRKPGGRLALSARPRHQRGQADEALREDRPLQGQHLQLLRPSREEGARDPAPCTSPSTTSGCWMEASTLSMSRRPRATR